MCEGINQNDVEQVDTDKIKMEKCSDDQSNYEQVMKL